MQKHRALYQKDPENANRPFAGTVVEVQVQVGDAVGVFAPLLRLADMGRLEVRARIDEVDVGLVAPGQAVTITVDAYPTQPLRGYLREVAPAVTSDRGTAYYQATVSIVPIPSVTLRLGMAANLAILAVEKDNALRVPRQAVQRVGAGYYVTVLRGGNTEQVRVALGAADAQYYEVLAGVEEGEWVALP